MSSAISITNLCHSYGNVIALKNISLEISSGDLHGLIGPDSGGKTTLMRILCALLPIQDGSATVLDLPLATAYDKIRANIGYMPQRFSLYQDLSVEENLLFFARLFGVSSAKRSVIIPQLYEFSRLGAFKKRRAGALSGGMKQKLALSCALIHRPPLLILDEPTFGVDPLSRAEFWEMLKSIKNEGTTIFVSTPYMDEAELCDHISLLYQGEILASDKPQQIVNKWNKHIYKLQANKLKTIYKEFYPRFESCMIFGNEIHIVSQDPLSSELISKWQEEYKSLDLSIESIPASMEDIFLSYMEKKETEEP